MNFCMPFLANDQAVNLIRMALIGEVAILLLLFSILKVVSICKGVDIGTCSFYSQTGSKATRLRITPKSPRTRRVRMRVRKKAVLLAKKKNSRTLRMGIN